MFASKPLASISRLVSRFPRSPVLIFLLLVGVVLFAGNLIFRENKKLIIQDEIRNLGAIADLRVAHITTWTENHRRRAEFFFNGAILPGDFSAWLQGGEPERGKEQILASLEGMRKVQGYKSISLFDIHGAVRISTDSLESRGAEEAELALQAMQSRQVVFLDLHRNQAVRDHQIELGFFAPLAVIDRQGGHVVGAIRLIIDPDTFLYPVMGSWPTPSQSAETYLLRREGSDVVFLNELRHRKGTALSLRFPVSTPELVAAKLMRGESDSMHGIDYRGVPVISAVRQVPGTPWLMVAKIDRAELLAPVTMLQRWVALLAFLFSAGGGLAIAAGWKSRQARQQRLRARQEAMLERRALIKHFDYLARFGNDIVILADERGRIVEANDRAAAAYGYTMGELRNLALKDILRPGADIRLGEIKRLGGRRFESVHVRKDKTEFPVEASVRPIEVEGKYFFQGIVRDISERRRAEEELKLRHALLSTLQETTIDGVLVVDEAARILLFNRRFIEMWDIPAEVAESGLDEDAIRSVTDKLADPQQFLERVAYLYAHKREISQDEIALKDGRVFERYSAPVVGNGDHYYGRVWYFHDVTSRKRALEALRQQKNFILQVIDTDPNYIFVKDAEGRFLLVNQAMSSSFHKTPSEIVGRLNTEINHNAAEVERHLSEDREVLQTRKKIEFMVSTTHTGTLQWLRVTKVPLKLPDGTLNVLGIAVDITDAKLAEEKLNASYRELFKVTARLEAVREEEQKRIARELHDEMGSVLTALNIHVGLLMQGIPADSQRLQDEVGDLAKLVDSGIQAMRRIVAQLRPCALDIAGLGAALKRHVGEFSRRTGVYCELRLPEEELKLDETRSTAIFRIVQEALTNVAKYAEASRVSVLLSKWNGTWLLTINDNGKGFDTTSQKAQSFGLVGIRERAALLGGKAEIISAAGKGTTVRVSMKLGEEENGD